MSITLAGMFAGLLIAVAALIGGFGGFILALIFGALGLLIGAHLDGRVDLAAVLHPRGRG